MVSPDIRKELLAQIEQLDDEQAAAVLSYIQALQSSSPPEDYEQSSDPTIGFLAGPTDLSSRTKAILREEITSRSGWTQKKD